MKRRLVVSIVAMLFVAMQFSMLGVMVSADTQVNGGSTECDTTLQMIPMTHTVGGGTVHWHITGENAKELRMLILDRLDNASIDYGGRRLLPNDTASGRKIGEIDEAEVWAFVGSPTSYLQHYLEGQAKMYVDPNGTYGYVPGKPLYPKIEYQGVVLSSSSLKNNNIYSDTSGLLGQTADSNADIDLFMTISMTDTVKVDEIDLSDPTLLAAPFECLTAFDSTGNVSDAVEYHGNAVLRHWTITIGFDSFSDPSVNKNTIQIIRTPAGELYRYEEKVESGSTMQDTMAHSEFDPLENPQILFIIMMVFGYLVVALPTHYYLRYRHKYPKKYRIEAKKLKGVHWTARLMLLLILLFYFWPVIGGFYISGPMFIGISVGFVAISAVIGKVAYDRAAASIPPEYFEKKKSGKRSPMLPVTELPVEPTYEPDSREKIHCIRCGALIDVEPGENLLKVRCPVCGALQKRVERSYNHLILDSSLKNTYNMLAEFLRDGDTALCLTTSMPGKLKRTYGLTGKVKCIWMTAAGGKDTLDPSDLERISKTVEKFSEKYPASIILIDGIEYLIIEHGFDAVSRFLKRITDVASMKDMTLVVPVNPTSLSRDELDSLRTVFDRVEALEDVDEREF